MYGTFLNIWIQIDHPLYMCEFPFSLLKHKKQFWLKINVVKIPSWNYGIHYEQAVLYGCQSYEYYNRWAFNVSEFVLHHLGQSLKQLPFRIYWKINNHIFVQNISSNI